MDEFGTTQMDIEGYTKWNKSGGKGQNLMISFITEILKKWSKQQVNTYKQQIIGYQKESGWRGKWVKGFNYMVTDGI